MKIPAIILFKTRVENMFVRSDSGRSAALSWLVIGVLGALEGLYGRTQYLGDWISYLNVSRAVSSLDWKGIFDPMWNPGYPVLIALVRGIFPKTAEGEWYAIFLLNWIIFLGEYACWRYLLRRAIEFHDPSSTLRNNPVIVWVTCCIFVSYGLCVDQISRVSPDLLVSTIFILAAAQTLQLFRRPTIGHAVALGLVLGAGYWVKGVFLSFSCIFLLTLFIASLSRKGQWRICLTATATYFLCAVPYIAAISWSYGQFTLGASGALNYAFHVNHLPHWTNWQGGPPQFGYPIHPTKQLLSDLPVFEFSEPFQTTYPPYNNMAYWYQGFRHFYSLRNEIMAILRSLYFLARIVSSHPFLYALILTLLVTISLRDWRISLVRTARTYWSLFLPAALGLATYLAVHVEDRYLGSFFLILSLLPLTPLLDQSFKHKRLLLVFITVNYSAGAVSELAVNARHTFKAAFHSNDFHDDSQWKMAAALRSYGFKSGDTVAIIGSELPNYRCSWAYVSRIRIIAEYGALPFSIEPWDRTRFDHSRAEQADTNYGKAFWSLTPEQRARVMKEFHRAGARAVVSMLSPDPIEKSQWRRLDDTDAWIYVFDSALKASN